MDGRQNILQQRRACAFFCSKHHRQINTSRRRLATVKYRNPKKFLRLLLAISVSLWISGAGCLWGCSKMAMASTAEGGVKRSSAVTGNSCHSKAHDCCAKKSPQNRASQQFVPIDTGVLGVLNEGVMNECPMAVNASAVVSKANVTSSDADQIVVFDPLALTANHYQQAPISPPVQYLNRGPTYLRCCTFLI